MSDFLQRLALRTLAPEQLARPRGASLFEPVAEPPSAALSEVDEIVEARPLPRSRVPRRAPRPGREAPAPVPARATAHTGSEAPAPPAPASAGEVAAPATRPVRRQARPRAHAPEPTAPAVAAPRQRAEPLPAAAAPDPAATPSPSAPDPAPADAPPVAVAVAPPQPAVDAAPVALAAEPDTVTLVERMLEAPAQPRPARRPPPARRERAPDRAPEPTVHVSIGRIEVRAVAPPAAPAPSQRAAASGPSLEDYLRERAG